MSVRLRAGMVAHDSWLVLPSTTRGVVIDASLSARAFSVTAIDVGGGSALATRGDSVGLRTCGNSQDQAAAFSGPSLLWGQ